MSGDTGFDIGGDFAVGDIGAEAVPSVTDIAGAEFITAAGIDELGLSTAASFQVPYEDIAGFGGYEQVGSFAGDAAYNDFFNAGGYIDNPAATVGYGEGLGVGAPVFDAVAVPVDQFVNPDSLGLPSQLSFTDQLKIAAAQVQSDFTGFVKGAQQAAAAYQKVAPLVNVVTAALKIPNPINQLVQPFQQAVGIAGTVAQGANAVGSLANAASRPSSVSTGGTGYIAAAGGVPVVDSVAPRTVEEIAAGVSGQETYDTALIVRAELGPEEQRLVAEREELKIRQGNNLFKIQELEQELQDPTLSQRSRDEIALELINLQAENGELAQAEFDVQQQVIQTREQLAQAETIISATNAAAVSGPQPAPGAGAPPTQAPSGSQIQNIARQVQADATGFVKGAQEASVFLQKNAPLVNLVSAALKVPSPVTQLGPLLQTATGVAGAVGQGAGAVAGLGNAQPSVSGPGTAPAYSTTSPTYTAAVRTTELLTPALAEYQDQLLRAEVSIQQENELLLSYQNQLADPNTTPEQRAELEAKIRESNDNIAVYQETVDNNKTFIASTTQELLQAQQIIIATERAATTAAAAVPSVAGTQYETVYNSTTGTYSIFDNVTGTTISTGLSEQQAREAQTALGITAASIALNSAPGGVNPVVASVQGGLSDEEILARQNPGGLSDEEVIARQNSITAGLTDAARNQQAIRSLRNNKAQSSDWRVRLRLAPNSNYLYNDPTGPGVLAPLKITDGVIFPYTPSIETAYKANYEGYDLTHSNYRGYFYKNSYVDAINLRATFTAQDTNEADYLLAVIHFFRSATKMFYGATDPLRGAPPPLVYLNGYGDYQFSEHPCVISQFNYNLPPDVDYIRAQNVLSNNTNLQLARLRNTIANNPLAYSVNRLLNSRLLPGALDFRPPTTNNIADGSPTYVPTKMEISISLLPIQSRQQVSQNFSVAGFANGNLLKGGYW